MNELGCQRELFDLPSDISYFNLAYQSPLLKSTAEAGSRAVMKKLRPHEITKDDFFSPLERVKSLFAELIDCPDSQRIAYQPSVSYGIASVVQNLTPRANGNIVMLAEQFPSNVLSYIKFGQDHQVELRMIKPPDEIKTRGIQWNKDLLEAIDQNTICVSVPHCHWSDGTLFDLVALRKKTSEYGALLIIDGTQSIGALPFSIQEIGPDALIVATYKFLLGPYSSALSYYGPYFDDKRPLEESWMNRTGSDQFDRLSEYSDSYRTGAYRYNVGECANFIALPMLADSLHHIIDWKPLHIQHYCKSLFDDFNETIRKYNFNIQHSSLRASHLFGIYPPRDLEPSKIVQHLRKHKVHVSLRGRHLRIAPYLYNDKHDVEKLASALLAL